MTIDYRCTCTGARGNARRLCRVDHPDCAALRGVTRHQALPGPNPSEVFAAMIAAAKEPGEAQPAVSLRPTLDSD